MKNTSISLLKKLANFKQEEFNIPKDTQAYGYKYAPLDTILPIIEPLLKKHGLWYFHSTGIDKKSWRTSLKTVIYEIEPQITLDETNAVATKVQGFISSETLIDDEVTLAKMNPFMVIGSALTYFRRYHLVVMLGLLTDEDTDTDGAVGGGSSVESATREQDWTKTFSGLIENKQNEKQVMAFFARYKKNFSQEQSISITEIINKAFKK